MALDVSSNYVITLLMIVIVLVTIVAGVKIGIDPAALPTGELLGGLLVLAGRLIKSD